MLKVRGDKLTVQGLLEMLSEAASLKLSVSGTEVTVPRQASSHLQRHLSTIISDPLRVAQVDVNTGRIHFGAFGEWQTLNAVNAMGIEQGAPGLGVAVAIHEIWENYISRDSGNKRGKYGPAHKAALAAERAVATELTGQEGGRAAAATVGEGATEGYILDYESYFLVLTARQEDQWPSGRFNAEVRDRVERESFDIDQLAAGKRVDPARIGNIIGLLREDPTATARITGERTEDQALEMAALRATAMRNAIIVGLDSDESYELDGIELSSEVSSPGANLGARRAWIDPEDSVADNPGASVTVEAPA